MENTTKQFEELELAYSQAAKNAEQASLYKQQINDMIEKELLPLQEAMEAKRAELVATYAKQNDQYDAIIANKAELESKILEYSKGLFETHDLKKIVNNNTIIKQKVTKTFCKDQTEVLAKLKEEKLEEFIKITEKVDVSALKKNKPEIYNEFSEENKSISIELKKEEEE